VVLPAVDEPEVVLEPLILPLPADLEVRARLPLPEVLLPRPLPEVILPLVLPEVEPIVEPEVEPIVEPEVEPIVPLRLPEVVLLPAVLPDVVPIVVVLPLVEPEVVPVWAKAVPEIRPKPSAKAAARSGRKICFFINRKRKSWG
jgi:signal-induced proliferation-associated 1 like protein 3